MIRHNLNVLLISGLLLSLGGAAFGQDQLALLAPVHKVQASNERLNMTVDTSRILSLDQKILQVQVNNPKILDLKLLSPNEVQISAKSTGVTDMTLWGEDKNLFTLEVVVTGDVKALTVLLQSQFPNSSLKVMAVSKGVMITGFVDRPEHVELISRISKDYYGDNVINAVTVVGVQQVLLHVKVVEVSRTKLRQLGFDFSKVTGTNVVSSGITGLIAPLDQAGKTGLLNSASSGVVGVPVLGPPGPGTETFVFGVVNGTSAFFGILEALRQDNLAKIMAEPTLVTISGRPAYFNVGGEFPVPVPQSLGTISIDYKKYGTQLDFVPVVLGHSRIRLEVRPRITELDPSRSITVAGTTVPGLRSREVETGVELQAGQSLAIAGLVQHRTEAINRGLPWLSDLPVVGALFRNVREESNEVELLIMVTPELVDAMDPQDVPPCLPGSETRSPTDCELYLKGFLEAPNCNSNCNGQNCQTCSECRESSGAAGGSSVQ